ncbi:uncharacterized protein LOC143018104 isoform X2 [Oratosquilla oratoria]
MTTPYHPSVPHRVILLLALLGALLPRPGDARQLVDGSSPYCRQSDTFLDCNYENTEEVVYLEKVKEGMKRLYIRNAQSVRVPWAACVPITFVHVHEVIFAKNQLCEGITTSLKLVNSHVNLIPSHVNRVDLEKFSGADEIEMEEEVQQLTVDDSKIGTLNLKVPVPKGITVNIDKSEIKVLQGIALAKGSNLIISNSNVTAIEGAGVLVGPGARANFWASRVGTSVGEGVVVQPRGLVSLSAFSGKLSVSGDDDEEEEQVAEGKPAQDPSHPKAQLKQSLKCGVQRVALKAWQWMVPTFLAVIEGAILVFLLLRFRQQANSTQAPSDIARTSSGTNLQGISNGNEWHSTYSIDSFNSSAAGLRNRMAI